MCISVAEHFVYIYKILRHGGLVSWMTNGCLLCGMLPPKAGLVMAAPPGVTLGESGPKFALNANIFNVQTVARARILCHVCQTCAAHCVGPSFNG